MGVGLVVVADDEEAMAGWFEEEARLVVAEASFVSVLEDEMDMSRLWVWTGSRYGRS